MRDIRYWVLGPVLGMLSVSALASMGGNEWSADFFEDSGYQGLPYPALVQELKDLATANPKMAEEFTYGTTPRGQPLVGIRVRQIKNPGVDAPMIVVTGAIHGNEFLGIEDKLPQYVLGEGGSLEAFQKFFAAGGEMVFIPVINPDGYIARRRGNSKGQDLNRDFELLRTGHKGSTQSETQAYTAFLKNELASTGRKLRFTLDYHCCIGATILPWAYGKGVALDPDDAPRYDRMRTLTKDALGAPSGTPWEILGYTADGSTIDYLLENYGSVSIGYEGAFKTEHLFFSKHAAFLQSVIQLSNDGKL